MKRWVSRLRIYLDIKTQDRACFNDIRATNTRRLQTSGRPHTCLFYHDWPLRSHTRGIFQTSLSGQPPNLGKRWKSKIMRWRNVNGLKMCQKCRLDYIKPRLHVFDGGSQAMLNFRGSYRTKDRIQFQSQESETFKFHN